MDVRYLVCADGISIASFRSWDFAFSLFMDVTESYGRDPLDHDVIANPYGILWASSDDEEDPDCHTIELLIR